jgi:hypothetical protein
MLGRRRVRQPQQAGQHAAAVNWWLSDPPHRAALLDPEWKQAGVAGVPGSAFPGVPNPAGTDVVDFGVCS